MADSSNETALRREARRRRILANSESRIKLIFGENAAAGDHKQQHETGLDSTADSGNQLFQLNSNIQTENITLDEFEADSSVSTQLYGKDMALLHNLSASEVDKMATEESPVPRRRKESNVYGSESENRHSSHQSSFGEITESGSTALQLPRHNVAKAYAAAALHYKLPFVVLACVTCLTLQSRHAYIFGHSALLPFVSAEIIQHILQKHISFLGNPNGNSFLRAALALSGLPQNTTSNLLDALHVVQNVGNDFAVYMFSFVFGQCLLYSPPLEAAYVTGGVPY